MVSALFTRFFPLLAEQLASTNDYNRNDTLKRVADEKATVHPDTESAPLSVDDQKSLLYTPHGRWEWSKGLSLVNPVVVQELDYSRDSGCTTTVRRAHVGGSLVTYINKLWTHSAEIDGFFLTLAVFKTLQRLQGDVIPFVIGAHCTVSGYSIAMEMPHDTLWIVARPNMPWALKQRCVSAFEKLHAAGILHGHPDLKNLLIGADGRVTIIDFAASRAMIPRPEIGLLKAEQVDLDLELQILKYQLGYDDTKKTANQERREKYALWVEAERQRQMALVMGYGVGPPMPSPLTVEDVNENLDTTKDLDAQWKNSSRHFSDTELVVVPGKTIDQVLAARSTLNSVVGEVAPLALRKRKASDVNPALPSSKRQRTTSLLLSEVAQGLPAATTNKTLKRKVNFPDQDISSKRLRRGNAPDVSLAAQYVVSTTLDRQPAVPHPPPLYESSSFAADVTPSLPAASSSNSTTSPIKIRDFATEQYEGRRGYYVPHPPTEGRMALNRSVHIRCSNCMNALTSQPPDAAQTYSVNKNRLLHGTSGARESQTSWALGTLKRSWASPTTGLLSDHDKRYQHTIGITDDIDDAPPRVFRCISDKGDFFESSDTIQLAPKPGRHIRQRDVGPSPSSSAQSILRSASLSSTVSYAKNHWPDTTLEGMDGPCMIDVTLSEGPVLNSRVNPSWRTSKFLTHLEVTLLTEPSGP